MRPLVSRRAERAFVNAWRRQGPQKAAPDFWSRETASRREREEEEEDVSLADGTSKWLRGGRGSIAGRRGEQWRGRCVPQRCERGSRMRKDGLSAV